MKFSEFKNKAKKASKKDMTLSILCFVAAIGLLVWFIIQLF